MVPLVALYREVISHWIKSKRSVRIFIRWELNREMLDCRQNGWAEKLEVFHLWQKTPPPPPPPLTFTEAVRVVEWNGGQRQGLAVLCGPESAVEIGSSPGARCGQMEGGSSLSGCKWTGKACFKVWKIPTCSSTTYASLWSARKIDPSVKSVSDGKIFGETLWKYTGFPLRNLINWARQYLISSCWIQLVTRWC